MKTGVSLFQSKRGAKFVQIDSQVSSLYKNKLCNIISKKNKHNLKWFCPCQNKKFVIICFRKMIIVLRFTSTVFNIDYESGL
jgi:hypothetical protein